MVLSRHLLIFCFWTICFCFWCNINLFGQQTGYPRQHKIVGMETPYIEGLKKHTLDLKYKVKFMSKIDSIILHSKDTLDLKYKVKFMSKIDSIILHSKDNLAIFYNEQSKCRSIDIDKPVISLNHWFEKGFDWTKFNKAYYQRDNVQWFPVLGLNSGIYGGTTTRQFNTEIVADYYRFIRASISFTGTLSEANQSKTLKETDLNARIQSLLTNGGNLTVLAHSPLVIINPQCKNKNLKTADLFLYGRLGLTIPELNTVTNQSANDFKSSTSTDSVIKLSQLSPSLDFGLVANFELLSDNNKFGLFGTFRAGYIHSTDQKFTNINKPGTLRSGFFHVMASMGLRIDQNLLIYCVHYSAFNVQEAIPLQIGLSYLIKKN